MKKLILPSIALMLCALLCAPVALAEPAGAAVPQPVGTASPRDWDTLAPGGVLQPDAIKGGSAVLIDAVTGKVLFAKEEKHKRYPASTTKIMTCLLALESGKDLAGIVTVGELPEDVFASDSVNISLKKGEKISFQDLLEALMLKSANDAADAIAIHVAGSVAAFVEQMNQRAQALGMTDTHYTCTNGLTNSEEHYTTALDMATLAMEAMKHPEFAALVSTPSGRIEPTNKTSKPREFSSSNMLLYDDVFGYVYAKGIKTGFTSMAKNCLVSAAEKDGRKLIAVDFFVEERNRMWPDSVTMFEYGFNQFRTINLRDVLARQTSELPVKEAAVDDPGQGSLTLAVQPKGDGWITGRSEEINPIAGDPNLLNRQITILSDTAPIQSGKTVGTITYFFEDKPVLTCDLVATRTVEKLATPEPTVPVTATQAPAMSPSAAPSASAPAQNGASGGGAATLLLIAALALAGAVVLVILLTRAGRRGARRAARSGNREDGNARMR